MLPGRFTLGLGTGENLNEHVTGARWPAPDERIEMLEEAIEVIRLLWSGGEETTHRGRHYTVDHARLYTLPRSRSRSPSRRQADRGRAGGKRRRRARHDRAEPRDRAAVP